MLRKNICMYICKDVHICILYVYVYGSFHYFLVYIGAPDICNHPEVDRIMGYMRNILGFFPRSYSSTSGWLYIYIYIWEFPLIGVPFLGFILERLILGS